MNKENRNALINRLGRLSYFFSKEMLKHEQEVKDFEDLCKKAEESGSQVVVVSGAENNRKVMRDCLKATNDCIDFLRKKDNYEYVEPWQEAGITAIFDKCNDDGVVPYDLPYTVQAILGMWDSLGEELKGV